MFPKKQQKILITLLAILLILILGLLVWAIQGEKISPKAGAYTATLSLQPSNSSINLNQTMNINVILNTGGAITDGTDVMLTYNPAYLEIIDSDTNTAGIQIKPGSLYPIYLGNSVDKLNGVIKLSGIINPGSNGYNGSGIFATITVKGIAQTSSTAINFNYTMGDTRDSNIVEHGSGEDILWQASPGIYSIIQ